jgi:hypothetical protein
MKKSILSVITMILALCATPDVHANGRGPRVVAPPRVILRFGTSYGVDGPFVGPSNAIRGIPGDDLPWEVQRIEGILLSDGRLTIAVRGLVFKDDPSVPPRLRGINDEDQFRAVVSCLTEEDDEHVGTANIFTQGFPATRSGNAFINARIKLPDTCVAPIVFVVSGDEDDWFTVTGIEREAD